MVPVASTAESDLLIGSLCTGALGLDIGVLAALGVGRLVWCADPDPHVGKILAERVPDVPNLGDVRTVDFRRVHPVDVVTAGFPCQDISSAGRRAGIEKGIRSGLWTHIVAAVRTLRPSFVVVENVAALRWRGGGLHRVLGDLAEAGYDALWRSVRASDIGAPHRRERVFLLAWCRQSKQAEKLIPAGELSARRKAVRRQCSPFYVPRLLPTPTAADAASSAIQTVRTSSRPTPAGCVTLTDSVRLLPTPAAINPNDGEEPTQWLKRRERHIARKINGNGMGMPLSIAVRLLPTPATPTGQGSAHGTATRTEVQLLPTPKASDTGTPGRKAGKGFRPPLSQQILDHTTTSTVETAQTSAVDWGPYVEAVRRWEHVIGRPTPVPTQAGRSGRAVLAPSFVEHLMGLPDEWVTGVDIPRTARLRALGNGVVPQQAAHAVGLLLEDFRCVAAGHEISAAA
jgi:DNA (cytosine-5)-methyltransferase 1